MLLKPWAALDPVRMPAADPDFPFVIWGLSFLICEMVV